MEQALVFLFVSMVFLGVYRTRIRKSDLKPGRKAAVSVIFFVLISGAAVALKYAAPGARWFYPAAWAIAAALVYRDLFKDYMMAVVFVLLFVLSILSFFILPYNVFTPYIFLPAGFIFLLILAEMHSDILAKYGIMAAYFFTLAAAYTVKLFILDNLQMWISLPVAALTALFLCVRNAKGAEHYMEEKTGMRTAAFLYVLLMLQCFAAAMIKNPFFK